MSLLSEKEGPLIGSSQPMAELRPFSFRVGITGHGLIYWLIPPLS